MTNDSLTLDKLLADLDRLGFNDPSRRPSGALGFWPRVIMSDYLLDEQPRKLTRRERFWLWVESLCDRAEIYYYGPRIKKTEPAPSYLIGQDLYISRRTAAVIRFTAS